MNTNKHNHVFNISNVLNILRKIVEEIKNKEKNAIHKYYEYRNLFGKLHSIQLGMKPKILKKKYNQKEKKIVSFKVGMKPEILKKKYNQKKILSFQLEKINKKLRELDSINFEIKKLKSKKYYYIRQINQKSFFTCKKCKKKYKFRKERSLNNFRSTNDKIDLCVECEVAFILVRKN